MFSYKKKWVYKIFSFGGVFEVHLQENCRHYECLHRVSLCVLSSLNICWLVDIFNWIFKTFLFKMFLTIINSIIVTHINGISMLHYNHIALSCSLIIERSWLILQLFHLLCIGTYVHFFKSSLRSDMVLSKNIPRKGTPVERPYPVFVEHITFT